MHDFLKLHHNSDAYMNVQKRNLCIKHSRGRAQWALLSTKHGVWQSCKKHWVKNIIQIFDYTRI